MSRNHNKHYKHIVSASRVSLHKSQSYTLAYTMDLLQSFMSDLLSQYYEDCLSIYVVSDNARIQQQQQQPAPSAPVSPRHLDYKGTTRWDSVNAFPRALGPPVRQISDGDG
jgi:hypothetical protein